QHRITQRYHARATYQGHPRMQTPVKTSAADAAWHAQPSENVLEGFSSSADGLTREQAGQRLIEHGRNELPAVKGRSPLMRFLAQFNNALIYFLLAAAVLAAILGHTV